MLKKIQWGISLLLLTIVATAQERYPIDDRVDELRGFTKSPTEHIIHYVDKPIYVRKVRGHIRSAGGCWPEQVEVLFEIRGPGTSNRIRAAKVDHGRFSMRRLAAGKYAFKATANGWQSTVGTIVVSPKSDQDATIDISMPLGV